MELKQLLKLAEKGGICKVDRVVRFLGALHEADRTPAAEAKSRIAAMRAEWG